MHAQASHWCRLHYGYLLLLQLQYKINQQLLYAVRKRTSSLCRRNTLYYVLLTSTIEAQDRKKIYPSSQQFTKNIKYRPQRRPVYITDHLVQGLVEAPSSRQEVGLLPVAVTEGIPAIRFCRMQLHLQRCTAEQQ